MIAYVWPLTQLAGWAGHHYRGNCLSPALTAFLTPALSTLAAGTISCHGCMALSMLGTFPNTAFPTHPLAGPRAPRQWGPPGYMIPNQRPASLLSGITCCRQGTLVCIATAQPGRLAWGPSLSASWLEKGSESLCQCCDFINKAIWCKLVSPATGFGSLLKEDSGITAVCPCRAF